MTTSSPFFSAGRRRGLWFGAWLALTGTVWAEVPAAPPEALSAPTLADAVDAAYARHQDDSLVQARRRVGQALSDRVAMPIAGDPSITVKYQTDRIGSDKGFREWESGVELPLWWPGQRSAWQREANGTLASADVLSGAKRLALAGQVREQLWQLALARSAAAEAKLANDSAQQLLHSVKRRVEAGELPHSDLILARGEALSAEDVLAQAGNKVRQAQRRLLLFTGLKQLPAIRPETVSSLNELPSRHPRLRLLASEVNLARARRDRVASERHSGTSLWVGGRTTRDVTGSGYDSALGLQLSIPLGAEVFNAPAVSEAEQSLTEAMVAQQRGRLELQSALASARLDYQRAEAAVTRAEQGQTLADQRLRMSQRAFELGESDLVRLLQARRAALTAHQNLQLRRLEVGQAGARLNQILGVIPQ